MNSISESISSIRNRITMLEDRYQREAGSVKLLAVSKTKPAAAVQAAYDTGQRAFGENQLQDALQKIEALPSADIEWHFIGPVQSNKTRPVTENFSWVQSLDRSKIAMRLSNQRPDRLPALNVCIQVNIGGEATKAGVEPSQLAELAAQVADLPRLKLRGLMAIPRPSPSVTEQRAAFAELRNLQLALIETGHDLDTLSIGMTDDMEAAIAEGSTMVRIGTAIFGRREVKLSP